MIFEIKIDFESQIKALFDTSPRLKTQQPELPSDFWLAPVRTATQIKPRKTSNHLVPPEPDIIENLLLLILTLQLLLSIVAFVFIIQLVLSFCLFPTYS